MKPSAETKLVEFFREIDVFTRKDLYDYFIRSEGELNGGTFGWRIYDLKKKGIIDEIRKGYYTVNIKPLYTPKLGKDEINIGKIISAKYKRLVYSLWNINWLNEFTLHQFNRDNIIIDLDKYMIESLMNILSKNGYLAMITALNGQLLSFASPTTPIILNHLISRAPIQDIRIGKDFAICVPKLEKILVDIYSNDYIFHFIKGEEMKHIFENATKKYSVNYTTLFGYARRRGKQLELEQFLKNNIQLDRKIIES